MNAALPQFVYRYADHPDSRVSWTNWTALLVAVNQPFYPFYVAMFATDQFAATFWTFLSTPFFLAVPLVSRWYPTASRAMVPLVGTANTFVAAKAIGLGTGVELFLIPCGLVAALAFQRHERWLSLSLIGVMVVLWAFEGVLLNLSSPSFDPSVLGRLASLHAFSTFGLTIVLAFWFAGMSSGERVRSRQGKP